MFGLLFANVFHLEFLSQYHSILNTPFSVVDVCEITPSKVVIH